MYNKFITQCLFAIVFVGLYFNSAHAYQDDGQKRWQSFALAPIKASLVAPFDHCFDKAARRYNLPKALILAVARGESDFDPQAVSSANAKGVMQINPITADHLGIKHSHLFKPCKNIDAGSRYLRELHNKYGNWSHTLAAYNYGPGRIGKTQPYSTLPKGAKWYVDYIYDHLMFVTTATDIHYHKVRKLNLITFDRPYRAISYVDYLRERVPQLQFSWFKKPHDKYEVVVVVSSLSQKRKAKRLLNKINVKII